jgi:hypothetical protein
MTKYADRKNKALGDLLSETSTFLGRIGELHHYENQIRSLRYKVQHTSKTDINTLSAIRTEIVEIRKSLRRRGYSLSLAKQRLIFDGFRHEDSKALGFRRAVLFITDAGIFTLTGEENHKTLANYLDLRIRNTRGSVEIKGQHYLWFRRDSTTLILSGSDTETKEGFERLQAAVDANLPLFLANLKDLK